MLCVYTEQTFAGFSKHSQNVSKSLKTVSLFWTESFCIFKMAFKNLLLCVSLVAHKNKTISKQNNIQARFDYVVPICSLEEANQFQFMSRRSSKHSQNLANSFAAIRSNSPAKSRALSVEPKCENTNGVYFTCFCFISFFWLVQMCMRL